MALPAITWPCVQKATYWPKTGVDRFGQSQWGTAIEISCRWDEEIQEIINPQGKTLVSKAVVIVDRSIQSGALAKSKLADVPDTSNPFKSSGWEVLGYRETPDLLGAECLYEVFL